MSMEISNRYENHYVEKVQSDQHEKTEKTTKNSETENRQENIPTPKDEYISSVKSGIKPSGLYRMGQDENGSPKIIYDNPQKAEKGKDVKSTEEITANTDQVDSEIEKLKREKEQLEQQIKAANGDEKKIGELEKELARIEEELRQKDNDTYRRQHAVISASNESKSC